MNAPLYRLSVAQYHDLRDQGILTEDDPVELIRGVLVERMTINPPHRVATRLVRRALERVLPAGWYADSQGPITTPDSEPEPDVIVAREALATDTTRHPGPGDVALIVEVSESSLDLDRGAKKELYASAGVPVYWIVNLVDQQLEVYTGPQGNDYASRTDLVPGDSVEVVIAGQRVGDLAVRELLP